MDEVELLKGVGDVWDDSAEIIESLHELRKRIEALCADAKGKDELAEIYKLVYAQVDLVLASLRVTVDRIQSSVHAPSSTGSAGPPVKSDSPTGSTGSLEKSDGAGSGSTEPDSALEEAVADETAAAETAASAHERLEVAAAEA